MKRCPTCNSTYEDVHAFCLADGTRLQDEQLAATVRYDPQQPSPTEASPRGSEQTSATPYPSSAEPSGSPIPAQQSWPPSGQYNQPPPTSWQQQQPDAPPPAQQSWGQQPQPSMGAPYAGQTYAARGGKKELALASAIIGIASLAVGTYVLIMVLELF